MFYGIWRGRRGGFGHCPDLFQGGPHAVAVGPAARRPGDQPVQAREQRVRQCERLGDIGAAVAWLKLVVPKKSAVDLKPERLDGDCWTQILPTAATEAGMCQPNRR